MSALTPLLPATSYIAQPRTPQTPPTTTLRRVPPRVAVPPAVETGTDSWFDATRTRVYDRRRKWDRGPRAREFGYPG